MRISKKALDFLLEASKGAYPNEFIGLLVAKNDVIEEVYVIPGSKFEAFSSSIPLTMVPVDMSIVGSVHSHPSPGVPSPSRADLNFFSRHGRIHIIVGYPFNTDTIAVFNSRGERINLDCC